MKYSALIIGCGNIGALYDVKKKKQVWTHAKAYHLVNKFEITFADSDLNKANIVSKYYPLSKVCQLPVKNFRSFNVVSITTPTNTHFEYLQQLLTQNIPVIICEKPITNNPGYLNDLKNLYNKSTSKVLVNYMRRFQPAYLQLKKKITSILKEQSLIAADIKYQRGLLNNGSHAFDLIEYLFDMPFAFEKFKASAIVYDSFKDDPTVSGICFFGKAMISIMGITAMQYRIFEIHLFFSKCKIVISDSGNTISYYTINLLSGSLQEKTDAKQVNIIEKYMLPVINQSLSIIKGKNEDNFLSSLELNRRILNIIKNLS